MNITSSNQSIKSNIPSIQNLVNKAKFAASYIASGAITTAIGTTMFVINTNIREGLYYTFNEATGAPHNFQTFENWTPMTIEAAKCSTIVLATMPLTYAVTKKLISKVNNGIQECGRLAGIQKAFQIPAEGGAIIFALFVGVLTNHYLNSEHFNADLSLLKNTAKVLSLGILAPWLGLITVREMARDPSFAPKFIKDEIKSTLNPL